MNLNYSLLGAKTHWIRSHDDKRSKLFSDGIRICCEVMTRRNRLVERKPFVGENFLLEVYFLAWIGLKETRYADK